VGFSQPGCCVALENCQMQVLHDVCRVASVKHGRASGEHASMRVLEKVGKLICLGGNGSVLQGSAG
jgi:hypothetical protein